MSSDADIIGKLSRIFETHTFSRGDNDWELDDLLEDLDYDQGYGNDNYSPTRSMGRSASSPPKGLSHSGLNGFASSGAMNSPQRMM